MTSLCWLASPLAVSPALLFSQCAHWNRVHYPTSTSWLFQQVLKMLPCGIVKKLIRLICRDCSSGGEERPGAICRSVVCLVGCDEWVERMLICAWKASQRLTLLRKQRSSSWHRETPTSRVLPRWRGGGDARHRGGSVVEATHSWRRTDPCLTSHRSWCVKPWLSKGYEPVKKLKKLYFHKAADGKHLPHQREKILFVSSWLLCNDGRSVCTLPLWEISCTQVRSDPVTLLLPRGASSCTPPAPHFSISSLLLIKASLSLRLVSLFLSAHCSSAGTIIWLPEPINRLLTGYEMAYIYEGSKTEGAEIGSKKKKKRKIAQ